MWDMWRNVVQTAKETMKNCSIPSRPWSIVGMDLLRKCTTRSYNFELEITYTVSIHTSLANANAKLKHFTVEHKLSPSYFVFMLHVINWDNNPRVWLTLVVAITWTQYETVSLQKAKKICSQPFLNEEIHVPRAWTASWGHTQCHLHISASIAPASLSLVVMRGWGRTVCMKRWELTTIKDLTAFWTGDLVVTEDLPRKTVILKKLRALKK